MCWQEQADLLYMYCVLYIYCLENHTFAAAKTSEKYESLHDAFAPVLEELNELLKSRQIIVKGKVINLDIVFGSDLKVL